MTTNFRPRSRGQVLAHIRGDDRYVFVFDRDSLPALMQVLGRFASDPELSLTWYDAAVLSQRVRKISKEAAKP